MAIEIDRVVRTGVITIAVVFGGLGIWMFTAPLHGAVVVHGLVKVETNRKTIQHNEGGIVRAILVKDGDSVQRGQTLIQLEDASVSAQYGIVRGALDAQLARQARLSAEATWQDRIRFPEEVLSRKEQPGVNEMLAQEHALFDARRSAIEEQLKLIGEQIAETRREAEALTQQQDAETEAQELATQELESYQKLEEQHYVAEVHILAQKRLVKEYLARRKERQAEIARANQRIQDQELRIAAIRDEYRARANEELKDTSGRVQELRERLQPSEDALQRQAIVAPVAGKVIGLRVHTEGATIGPREPLLDIIPGLDKLIIEAQAPLDSIRQIHVGQYSEIRFSALPYRTTPMVDGSVTYISADALADKNGVPFYQVHVTPAAESLADARIEALDPGMAAEVYIQTQERTAMQYLMRPITDTILRSFREN